MAASDHKVMQRRLRKLRARQLRLDARQADFEKDRLALFNEAREMDPPFTWQEIADIMGVTLAGIANLVKRANGRSRT